MKCLRGCLLRAGFFLAVWGVFPLAEGSKNPPSSDVKAPEGVLKSPVPTRGGKARESQTPKTPALKKKSAKRGTSSQDPQVLVLQWEVSHSRNTDQISLIFREEVVEMVTNTSSWQDREPVRLGRFYSPYTRELQNLKAQIHSSHLHRQRSASLLSMVAQKTGLKTPPHPHRPVLRINGEEWQEGDKNFAPLLRVISSSWSREWKCLECAVYERQNKSIVRTFKKSSFLQDGEVLIPPGKKTETHQTRTKVFSLKSLGCRSGEEGRPLECVDPQFGIFEL